MTIEEMKARAISEMDKYIQALDELADSRLLSLAEGELAAYAKLGLLFKGKSREYLDRLNGFRHQLIQRVQEE